MDLKEKRISSKIKYKGKIFTITNDKALLANGSTAERDVVLHNGASAIVACDERNRICLVRQYRYSIQRELLEIPAGKLELNEDPFEAAKRELEEETGFVADEWVEFGTLCPAPGYSSEVIFLYLAKGLHKTAMNLDDDEILEPVMMPLSEVLTEIKENRIDDAKTIAGIFRLLQFNNFCIDKE